MIYVEILPGENLSSIYLAKMDLFHWSFWSSSGSGGDGVKTFAHWTGNYTGPQGNFFIRWLKNLAFNNCMLGDNFD